MGPMCFDYGFGPYRWVCCSGKPEDLATTDRIAREVLESMMETAPPEIMQQMKDNIRWIREAGDNNMVVGSQARILYADDEGRRKIASAMNKAIADGELSGPVVLGLDHHDVSGTDSPYRETANIRDGSMWTADMAVQNFVGDALAIATFINHLTSQRLANAIKPEATGLMTHHLNHDPASWRFIERLLEVTQKHPVARWISIKDLLENV